MGLLVLALTLFIPSLAAQEKLQTFEVAIVDSHGNPIEGLNIDDFQLQDDGKHYRLAVFRSNAMKTDAAPLRAHQFSNRAPGASPTATVILMDVLNLNVRQLIFARDQLISALEHLNSQEYVLLYFLTSHGIVMGQGFPQAPAGGPDNRWMARIASILQGVTGSAIDDADRPEATAQALEAAANLTDGFRGGKSVVWITGSPPGMGEAMRNRVAEVFSAKGIGVYIAGEFALFGNGVVDATGGHAYLDREIAKAIKDAMSVKEKSTYTIGFYPEQWDGKAHRLQLKCTRRGAVVSAREQYIANPDQALPVARRKAAVDRLAAAAFDAPDIGLQVSIAPSPKLAGGTHVKVRIDASDLRLWRQDDYYAGQLSTTIVYYDGNGRREVLNSADHEFHLTAQQRDAATQSGIGLAEDRQIPSSAVKMRIIVFDPHSNAAGSITFPITGSDRRNSVSP